MPRLQWRELVERRVPQVIGVYLAAGWGLLEFTSWAADRLLVPAGLVNTLLAAWLLFLPVAAVMAWRGSNPSSHRPATRGDGASVAVLPFENLSPNPADAYLGDGLTDEITTALARIRGLRVAARTSTRAMVRRDLDVQQLGRKLNVSAVLEGEVQRADDQLRVRTRLVNVADGYQLWAGRYDASMADVFAIEDEISGSVARTLEVLLRHGEGGAIRAAPRTDVRAYEYYLKGRQFFHQTRRKSLRYARALFRRTLDIDPSYAPAHAALAEAIALERMYYEASGGLEEAERASLRALELAPDLADAHAARGAVLFVSERYEPAEEAFRAAIRLDPGLFEAHYFFGRMLFQRGRFEEAAREFGDAASVRDDYQAAFFGAQALEALGADEEARTHYAAALEQVADHMELNPDDPRAATMRAVALYRIGRHEEGLEWGRRAVEIDPEDPSVRYNLACLYAVAGEVDRSIEAIASAIQAGFGNREWLERDPDLTAIRDDPRFRALLEARGGGGIAMPAE